MIGKITSLVNQQAVMVLLILGPIIVFLIAALPLLIRLLYTAAFLPGHFIRGLDAYRSNT
jgi:hypothetical protein